MSRGPLLLELDLTADPIELEPEDLLGRLRARQRPRLRAMLRTLHEAGDDPRVRGLIVKIGGGFPWATVQDLRAGLLAFAASGKPVIGWAETLGEGGNGTAAYVLAAACTRCWLQPTGEVALLGLASETTFLRGALDKLGVQPQLEQRAEYKNAADRIMRSEFTPAHREASERLVESIWDGAVAAIAADRSMPPDEVRGLADRAPLGASEARDAGLIDRLGYRDEAYADARAAADSGATLLFAEQWTPPKPAGRRVASLVHRRRGVVALIDAYGQIVSGRSRGGAPGGRRLGSDSVSAALRAARADDDVRAVVLRVDSPGGSGVASDTIWREVVLTREAGTPVIVSMGAIAGSGGYFIACPADVIVARPATLTGSIGVFGGKIVVADLLERVGLTTGTVSRGAHSLMSSPRRPYSENEHERLVAMIDRVYADFVQKVADGRGMDFQAVDAIAKGRVWTGADAAERGLVDELGGLRDAVRIARERGGLPHDATVRRALHVPPAARLRRPHNSEDPRAASITTGLGDWGDLAALAAGLGLPPGLLHMPVPRLR